MNSHEALKRIRQEKLDKLVHIANLLTALDVDSELSIQCIGVPCSECPFNCGRPSTCVIGAIRERLVILEGMKHE